MHKLLAGLLALTLVFLPGCASPGIPIPRVIGELSLAAMWDELVEGTGMAVDTAQLESFNLRSDKAGNVLSLYGVIYANNERGEPMAFSVSRNYTGELSWRTSGIESIPLMLPPGYVFTEIDAYGLGRLVPGDNGLSILVDFKKGSLHYSRDYLDIFQLTDGKLLPLQEVLIQSQEYWCTISVFQSFRQASNTESTLTRTITAPMPQGERTSQIWFLSRDISRAKTVEYSDS